MVEPTGEMKKERRWRQRLCYSEPPAKALLAPRRLCRRPLARVDALSVCSRLLSRARARQVLCFPTLPPPFFFRSPCRPPWTSRASTQQKDSPPAPSLFLGPLLLPPILCCILFFFHRLFFSCCGTFFFFFLSLSCGVWGLRTASASLSLSLSLFSKFFFLPPCAGEHARGLLCGTIRQGASGDAHADSLSDTSRRSGAQCACWQKGPANTERRPSRLAQPTPPPARVAPPHQPGLVPVFATGQERKRIQTERRKPSNRR